MNLLQISHFLNKLINHSNRINQALIALSQLNMKINGFMLRQPLNLQIPNLFSPKPQQILLINLTGYIILKLTLLMLELQCFGYMLVFQALLVQDQGEGCQVDGEDLLGSEGVFLLEGWQGLWGCEGLEEGGLRLSTGFFLGLRLGYTFLLLDFLLRYWLIFLLLLVVLCCHFLLLYLCFLVFYVY